MSFTQALILANIVVYFLQQLLGQQIYLWFAFWPGGESLLAPWQWLSYSFLHGSVTHIAFNMFGVWMFGTDLERVWGARRLAAAYFASVLFGALAQMLSVLLAGGPDVPVIGASAGVFGLLLAFALVFPERRVFLLFLPIPLPARVFVLIYAVLELGLGVSGVQSGVAHFAHLGGLLGGWLVYRYWHSGPRSWRRRR